MERWLEIYPQFAGKEWNAVGHEIYRRRKKRGWTQEDLAGYMNSDHRLISRHENGESMNVETLVKYAAVFDCSVDDLLQTNNQRGGLAGLSSELVDTLQSVASLPEEDQQIINDMLKNALRLAKRVS